jgi:hypothetical protein
MPALFVCFLMHGVGNFSAVFCSAKFIQHPAGYVHASLCGLHFYAQLTMNMRTRVDPLHPYYCSSSDCGFDHKIESALPHFFSETKHGRMLSADLCRCSMKFDGLVGGAFSNVLCFTLSFPDFFPWHDHLVCLLWSS